MLYNELYLSLSLIVPMFVFMIDYGFGRPGDETFNHNALLFSWSYFLAKNRLKILGEWEDLARQHNVQIQHAQSRMEEIMMVRDFRRTVFDRARPFFRWEMAIGMCPICTCFWLSLFTFLMVTLIYFRVNICYFGINIITFVLYFLLSHLLIRLMKKI